MPIKKRFFIIGFAILAGLILRVGDAHALYSPRLSKQVASIRGHMESSQAQNGHGSVLGEIEYFTDYDEKEAARGSETGIAGDAQAAQDLVFESTYWQQIQNPFDSLMMAFQFNAFTGEFISTCLRDEIWQLEVLRDTVGQEMIKAYMLRDTYHGDILTQDYKYLVAQLDLLRFYGSNPYAKMQTRTDDQSQTPITVTSNEYFFGTEPTGDKATNYYISVFPRTSEQIGCPSSEFDKAFEQVGRSWKTLSVLASGGGADWGSILTMAKANARVRAQQWIRANQIGLTLGGETGARPQSLVKGGGWDKFVGSVKTQWKILENMVGPVTPLYNLGRWIVSSQDTNIAECVSYSPDDDKFRNCDEEQRKQYLLCKNEPEVAMAQDIRCDRFKNTEEIKSFAQKAGEQVALQEAHQNTIDEVKDAFVYHVSLENVAEQNIYAIDTALWDMNGQIKRGYENVDENAGKGIPTLTYKLGTFADKQCVNR